MCMVRTRTEGRWTSTASLVKPKTIGGGRLEDLERVQADVQAELGRRSTTHVGGNGMRCSRAWCGTPPILGVVNMAGTRTFTCYMGAL